MNTILQVLSLIRFSHTLFALPFALLAAMMAWHLRSIEWTAVVHAVGNASDNGTSAATAPQIAQSFAVRWQEVVGILLCMICARSFAMAVNRLADRKYDAANPRTAGRHLPAGILSVGSVQWFAIGCAAAFIASTLLFLPNWLPLFLSVPVLAFLGGYSYAKRFTALSHFWLGTALAMSPVAAWVAIRGDVVIATPADLLAPIVLGGAVLCWVAGFDILYACQDADFDQTANLHSVPVLLGVPGALRLAAACHLLTLVMLAALPFAYPAFGGLYWLGLAAVAGLLIYEHALVKPDDLTRVNLAFFNVNAVISIGLFAVGSLDLWLGFGR